MQALQSNTIVLALVVFTHYFSPLSYIINFTHLQFTFTNTFTVHKELVNNGKETILVNENTFSLVTTIIQMLTTMVVMKKQLLILTISVLKVNHDDNEIVKRYTGTLLVLKTVQHKK